MFETVPASRTAFEQSKDKRGLNNFEHSKGELKSIKKNNLKPRESLEQFWQVGKHLNNLKTKGAEQILNYQKES